MKKIKLLFPMLLFIVAMSFTINASAQKTISLKGSPTAIEVNANIHVEVIQSNKNEMEVIAKPKDLETFRYKMTNGQLILGRENRKFSFKKLGDIEIVLYLTDINRIKEIEVTGASNVVIRDEINIEKLEVDVSGSSKVIFNGKVYYLSLDLSGASNVDARGFFEKIGIDLSGASTSKIRGDFDIIKGDISGASKLACDGKGQILDLELSGASSFNGRNCYVVNAVIEASGASNATIHADEITSDSSGMSRIKVLPYK